MADATDEDDLRGITKDVDTSGTDRLSSDSGECRCWQDVDAKQPSGLAHLACEGDGVTTAFIEVGVGVTNSGLDGSKRDAVITKATGDRSASCVATEVEGVTTSTTDNTDTSLSELTTEADAVGASCSTRSDHQRLQRRC